MNMKLKPFKTYIAITLLKLACTQAQDLIRSLAYQSIQASQYDNLTSQGSARCDVNVGRYAFFSCDNGYMATSPLSDLSKIIQPSWLTGTYNATNNSRLIASWSQTLNQTILRSVNVRDNITLAYDSKVYSLEPLQDYQLSLQLLQNLQQDLSKSPELQIANSIVINKHIFASTANKTEGIYASLVNLEHYQKWNYKAVRSIDLYNEGKVVYAFARSSDSNYILESRFASNYSLYTKYYYGVDEDCGTYIRATRLLLISSCPSYKNSRGLISIYLRRKDDKIVNERSKLLQQIVGDSPANGIGRASTTSDKPFQLVETTSGSIHSVQIISMLPSNRIIVHNFIYKDPDTSDIGDPIRGVIRQHLSQALFDLSFIADDYKRNNESNKVIINSQIAVGSGGEFLIINERNPLFIYTGQMCDFQSIYHASSGKCKLCPKGSYSPMIQGAGKYCQQCDQVLQNEYYYSPSITDKMKVLCSIFNSDQSSLKSSNRLNLILGLTLSLTLSCFLATVGCIIWRKKRNNALNYTQSVLSSAMTQRTIILNPREIVAIAPQEQQREFPDGLTESQKTQIKNFLKKMAYLPYQALQGERNDIAEHCPICLKEFQEDKYVSMTACNHIFHKECIIQWIKWKLPRPGCPNCRQVFKK
ncbi:hypothetical protein FGO68_gene17283 [Halteria grandinella]|uniref:RING-type domain-containing protein n=1 Tax=Halteria grandinella TaxID=5974 RepID=A0A8J8T3Z4_HALGN|nr:hypothetical protein FGO68_gene17283 [Halteria grandinella]